MDKNLQVEMEQQFLFPEESICSSEERRARGSVLQVKWGGVNDLRSRLCLSYIDLLKTMRPRWFVWENVPGVFSTNGGEDFRQFLTKIDEIGYSASWSVLDAQYIRVPGFPRAIPQRRRRVFVVGCLMGWEYSGSVLFEPDCLSGDSPPRRIKGKGFTDKAEICASDTSWNYTDFRNHRRESQDAGGRRNAGQGKETLSRQSASSDRLVDGSKSKDCLVMSIGNGQVNELENAQVEVCQTLNTMHDQQAIVGFDGYNQTVTGDVSHTLQNAATDYHHVPCVFWNGEDVSSTLTEEFADARMPDKGKLPCVIGYENHSKDSRITEITDGVFPTISAASGTGGNNLPLVKNATGVMGVCTKGNGDAFESPVHTSVSTGGGQLGQGTPAARVGMTVRRLLPIETERLMAFPDNWTRIPWKGKPAEECPDSPRYKACGNSMCVNVMRWIGMRIELVERKMRKEEEK